MSLIRLSWRARQALEQIARTGSNARMVRRAQALLWLHAGESADAVARRLGLTRRAVYKIAERFEARAELSISEHVSDQPHTGRPADKRLRVVHEVEQLLKEPPSRYGYRAFAWTTPMLRRQVEYRLEESVSARTALCAAHCGTCVTATSGHAISWRAAR